jgi:hypothetical protein
MAGTPPAISLEPAYPNSPSKQMLAPGRNEFLLLELGRRLKIFGVF